MRLWLKKIGNRYGFWSLALLLHLVFAGYQLGYQRYYLLDSIEYIQVAKNLETQGTFFSGDLSEEPLRMDHYSKRPPLYPLLLWTIRRLTDSETGIIWVQLLCSLFNLALLLRMGKLLGWHHSRPPWLLLMLVFYPAQLIYTNLVMAEILFQSLLCLLAYALLQAVRSQNLRYLAFAALWICLGMLCKPILYLFSIPFLLLCGWWAWQWKNGGTLFWGIIPILVVLLYSGWNQQRTGYFHFSSIQNLSLLQYTTYNLLMNANGPDLALAQADSILYASLEIEDYGASQRYLQRACFEVIREYKADYLVFHFKGMLNFFLDPGRFDLYHFFGLETVGGEGLQIAFSRSGYAGVWQYFQLQSPWILLLLVGVLLANGLKLLALLIFPFLKKVAAWDRLLLLLLIGYVAGLTGVSGASRFAVPLFPLLLLVLGTVVDRWQNRNQPQIKRQ